jgi:hypothetical protein
VPKELRRAQTWNPVERIAELREKAPALVGENEKPDSLLLRQNPRGPQPDGWTESVWIGDDPISAEEGLLNLFEEGVSAGGNELQALGCGKPIRLKNRVPEDPAWLSLKREVAEGAKASLDGSGEILPDPFRIKIGTEVLLLELPRWGERWLAAHLVGKDGKAEF